MSTTAEIGQHTISVGFSTYEDERYQRQDPSTFASPSDSYGTDSSLEYQLKLAKQHCRDRSDRLGEHTSMKDIVEIANDPSGPIAISKCISDDEPLDRAHTDRQNSRYERSKPATPSGISAVSKANSGYDGPAEYRADQDKHRVYSVASLPGLLHIRNHAAIQERSSA